MKRNEAAAKDRPSKAEENRDFQMISIQKRYTLRLHSARMQASYIESNWWSFVWVWPRAKPPLASHRSALL
jgi:hypothetical protein